MINFSDFKKIGNGIYQKKKFLSESEINFLLDSAKKINNWCPVELDKKPMHYYQHCADISFVYDRLKLIVNYPLILDDSVYFQRYTTGQYMAAHRDDNRVLDDIELSKKYKDGDSFKIVRKPEWGIVLYLQKTKGGDVHYPNQNITIEPMPGDLLFHKAQEECTHEVTKLISKERIIIPTYIYTEIKVPIL